MRRGADVLLVVDTGVEELEAWRRAGRVPLEVMLQILDEERSRVEEQLYAQCPSWAENFHARFRDDERGLNDDAA